MTRLLVTVTQDHFIGSCSGAFYRSVSRLHPHTDLACPCTIPGGHHFLLLTRGHIGLPVFHHYRVGCRFIFFLSRSSHYWFVRLCLSGFFIPAVAGKKKTCGADSNGNASHKKIYFTKCTKATMK